MSSKEKNLFLDFLKGLIWFGIVFVHVKIPNYQLDGMIQAVFRTAIPFFFMISGYYIYNSDKTVIYSKIPGKIKHLLKIALIGMLYNFVYMIAIGLFGQSHGGIEYAVEIVKEMFTKESIIAFVIFNQDPVIKIFWFLFALLNCYILLYVILKLKLEKICYCLIPILLGVHLYLGNILFLYEVDVPVYYYRNYLLFGLPFFMLGYFIRTNEKIVDWFSNKKSFFFIGLGVILAEIEWFVFARQELYFGSILLAIGLFVLALNNPQWKGIPIFYKIGGKYSFFIYTVHFSVMGLLNRIIRPLGEANSIIFIIIQYLKPIIVFSICVISAIIFYQFIDFVKIKVKSRR